ncbi:hypothetical protein TSAR_001781 [Trichomalopsis sarcophagae]|uniref:Uncharacterized protein n=1 Tax=Trichomalopsis sarcophagae TaxID=543379 RepID=A0A232EFR1_9HYME|nr:hypothetical protein TSAR_001781 [Trichomalopsis sarcophagae]
MYNSIDVTPKYA